MVKSEIIDITVTLVHETEKAWKVNDGKKEFWVPKSIGELEKRGKVFYELSVPEWLAEKEDLL